MNLIPPELQDRWVRFLDESAPSVTPRDALAVLSVATSDPRLGSTQIRTEEDLERVTEILAENFNEANLSSFGIEDPERATDALIRAVVEYYGKRLDGVRIDMPDVRDGGDSERGPRETDSGVDGTDDSTNSESNDSIDLAGPEELDDSNEGDSLVLSPSEFDVDSFTEDVALGAEAKRFLEFNLGDCETAADIDALATHLEELAALVDTQEGADQVIGYLAFAHLAEERPEAVTPYLDTVETGLRSEWHSGQLLALLAFAGVAMDTPETLHGHMDGVWDLVASGNEIKWALALDIVEQLGREIPLALATHVDALSDGLCHEEELIRRDAALGLRHIAEKRPGAVTPYAGMLVQQLEYDDNTSGLAADVLHSLAKAEPESVVPFAEQMQDRFRESDHPQVVSGTLATIRELLSADEEIQVDVDELLPAVQETNEDVAGTALTVVNELAKQDPETVTAQLDELITVFDRQNELLDRVLVAVLTTVSEEDVASVLPYLKRIVRLLDRDHELITPVLNLLENVAQKQPEEVSGHLSRLEPYLTAQDEITRGLAVRIFAHVGRHAPTAVTPYLSTIEETASMSTQTGVLVPALDVVASVAKASPRDAQPLLPTITSLPTMDVEGVPQKVLQIAIEITESSPVIVAEHLDQLLPQLRHESETVQHRCVVLVRELAETQDVDIIAAADWLLTEAQRPEAVTESMLLAISKIAQHQPEVITQLPIREYFALDDEQVHSSTAMILASDSEQFTELQIENIDTIASLLSQTQSNRSLAALLTFKQVASEDPNSVEPYCEKITEYLTHDEESHRRLAIDILEQFGRTHPDRLVHTAETIAALAEEPNDSIRRDAVLCLGYIANEDLSVADPHLNILQRRLSDSSPLVSSAATVATMFLANTAPEKAEPATELLIEQLERQESAKMVALNALGSIGVESPQRLVSHVDTIAEMLDHDSAEVRNAAVKVLGYASRGDGAAVSSYLPQVLPFGQQTETVQPVADIARNVAQNEPEVAADNLDDIISLTMSGDTTAATSAFLSLYYLAKFDVELVLDYLPLAVDLLSATVDNFHRSAALLLGGISQFRPDVVEPHVEELLTYVERDDGDEAYLHPAIDALYNIAQNDQDALEGELSRIEAIESNDPEVQQLIEKILSLYRDVDIDDGDGDGDYSPSDAVSSKNESYATDNTQVSTADALQSAD